MLKIVNFHVLVSISWRNAAPIMREEKQKYKIIRYWHGMVVVGTMLARIIRIILEVKVIISLNSVLSIR